MRKEPVSGLFGTRHGTCTPSISYIILKKLIQLFCGNKNFYFLLIDYILKLLFLSWEKRDDEWGAS